MTLIDSLVEPSLSFVGRATLPGLATSTSSTSKTSSTSSGNSGSTTSQAKPGISSSSKGGLPGLTSASTSTTQDFTTPSIGIPSNSANPYISRTSQPSGTVFIAVGSVVAAILIVFALYHLLKSLTASSVAKKAVNNEKFSSQRFAHNNSLVYGAQGRASQATFPNTEYKGSVSKLPLMNNLHYPSSMAGPSGNDSFAYNVEDSDLATSRQDLTNMFISPTKEMTGNRTGSHAFNNSVSNVSLYGRSTTDLGPGAASNKRASAVPNYYINDNFNNSQYDLSPEATEVNEARGEGRKPRNPIPSMYLEDLIDS